MTKHRLKVRKLFAPNLLFQQGSNCLFRKEGLAAKSSRRRRVNVKALKRKWDRRGRRTDRRQGALDLLVDDGKRKEDRTRERRGRRERREIKIICILLPIRTEFNVTSRGGVGICNSFLVDLLCRHHPKLVLCLVAET